MLCRYPDGFTLLFIPFHSSAYTGFHWAVYNEDEVFYGFDDDDITSGMAAPMHLLRQAFLDAFE